MRRRFWKRVRRTILFYGCIGPSIFFLSRLPLPVARAAGSLGGTLAYLFAFPMRRLALQNLRSAFQDSRSEGEIRAICRGSFKNATTTVMEFLVIRRWSVEKIDRTFQLRSVFDDVGKDTSHCVAITAHFGNWEVLGIFFARYLPGHIAVGATKHSNHKVQECLDQWRQGMGIKTVYSDDSPREFIRCVRDGRLLGLLPDQNLRTPNGVFVPFFGRPAYTTTIPVNIARTTKAHMCVCVLVREGKGFRVIFHNHIQRPWTRDRKEDLQVNTERFTQILEEEIRKRPDQWVWFHDRWRTAPGDEGRYAAPRWIRKRKTESNGRVASSGETPPSAATADSTQGGGHTS